MAILKSGMLRIILCMYLILTTVSYANSEPVYPKDTVVLYGNGILTEEYGAYSDMLALKRRLSQKLADTDIASMLTFDVAYNRTDGILDLVEVFSQYFGSITSHFWHWLAGIDALPDFAKSTLSLMAELTEGALLHSNSNVLVHDEKYNQLLAECKRVVVVAHSQGNFYANIAAEGIDSTLANSFAVVSVANPDSDVAGNGPYTTIAEDKLIGLILGAMSDNLQNYGSNESYSPWLGHYFVANYLVPNHEAEKKIINDIVQTIHQVRDVENINSCGWPAVWGDSIRVVREPPDFFSSIDTGNLSYIFWGVVWPAVLNNTLVVEYRLGTSGSWVKIPRDTIREGGAWVSYERPLIPPYVFFNNSDGHGSIDLSGTVEVQPDDVNYGDPKGIQQYRLSIDGKVIDQFTVDYHTAPWSPVRTSGPIREPLREGSYPIQEIIVQ